MQPCCFSSWPGNTSAGPSDLALYHELKPNLDAAWEWVDRYGNIDGSGYVQYQAHTPPKASSAALTVGYSIKAGKTARRRSVTLTAPWSPITRLAWPKCKEICIEPSMSGPRCTVPCRSRSARQKKGAAWQPGPRN